MAKTKQGERLFAEAPFRKVWNRMTVIFGIALISVITVPAVSLAGDCDPVYSYGPCSTEHECICVDGNPRICSDGCWWDPAPDECRDVCSGGTTTTSRASTSTTTTTTTTTTSRASTTSTSTASTTTVPPSNGKTHGSSDDPVNTATGEYYFDIPVFHLGGPLPLMFSLHYGSLTYSNSEIKNAFDPGMGTNWLHNFNIALSKISDLEIHILYDKGKIIRFEKAAGGWTLKDAEDTPYQLQVDTSAYYLMDPSKDWVYKFDTDGRMVWIKNRNNNTLTFTYNGNTLTGVSDGLGRTLTLSYTDSNLTSVCDGNNRCIYLEYDTKGWMTAITDVLSKKTRYEYDTAHSKPGLITRTIVPRFDATDTTQTYDAQGRVATQKDAYDNTVAFLYADGTTTIQNPDQTTVQHTHVNQQLLTKFIDEAGKQSKLGYDDNNRRNQVTDTLDNPIAMTFHPESGKLKKLTDELGFTAEYTYTAQSQSFDSVSFTFYNITRIDYSDGSYETFTYDNSGNILTQTDRMGNQTSWTYNSRGQVLTETNAASGKMENGYNDDGTVAWGQTADIGKITYDYDAFKRLIKTTYPDGTSTQWAYDAKDRVIKETDAMGRLTEYTYDANGNRTAILYPNTASSEFEYDRMNRVVKYTNPNSDGAVTKITYNSRGLVDSVTDGDNITHQYGYDSRGRNINETDGADKIWQTGYNDEGIPISRTTPLGFTTNYTVNAAGQVVEVTNALGQTKVTSIDNQGRITSVKDAINRQTNFTYNAAGMLTKIENSGIAAAFARDALGQIREITDNNGQKWSFAYTAMGRLAEQSDPLGRKWTRTHDNQGRLKTITYPDGEIQTMTYDAAGNLIKRSFSGGLTLNYSFDSRDQVTAADGISFELNLKGQVTKTTDEDVSFGALYSKGGRLESVSYANDRFQVNYTYDARGLLSEVTDTLTGAKITFTYDDDMRMTRMTRSNGVNTDFSWDKAGRLIQIQDGNLSDQQYSLNAAGEVARAVCNVPLSPSPESLVRLSNSYAYNAALEVSSAGYAYDARGHMTQTPLASFQWDSAGRVIGAGQAVLTYNGLGDLRTRAENNATIHYYYNYGIEFMPPAAEKNDTTGAWKRFYVWSPQGRLLYGIDAEHGNAVFFYHFDRIGSTLFLTDSTGKITDKYAYSPYGLLLDREGTSDQPFTFVGQRGVRMEGITGIYHMRSRYYDSMTGRFLSKDSQWPDTSRIHGTNPYLYADANPVLYIDSTGNSIMDAIEGGINLFTEHYFSTGTKKTNSKFVNWLDDLGKWKIVADTIGNEGWIVQWSKYLGITGGITCNILNRLYPTVAMKSVGSMGLNAARCRIPSAPFKIMEGGKMASKAFVLLAGAVSMYEMTEWALASPDKAAASMQSSLSYKAVEVAEKVPGVDKVVQFVGSGVQKAVESGLVDHTVGYNAPGSKMVEALEQNVTMRDYVVRPVGRVASWIFGYGD